MFFLQLESYLFIWFLLLFYLVFFQFPFSRDILLSYGLCDVSRKSIRHILTDEKGGNAAIIVVGGAAESLDAHPGSCILTLKNRKGFIREALTTGCLFIYLFFCLHSHY